MVDAPEKIWAVFGNHGLLAFRDDRPHSVEYTRSDLVAELEAENERRILSALEPAAPEGQQPTCIACDDKPVAPNDPCAVCGTSARPTEQAVTREMVNAAYNTGKDRCMTGAPNDFRAVLKSALKAAMEAGR